MPNKIDMMVEVSYCDSPTENKRGHINEITVKLTNTTRTPITITSLQCVSKDEILFETCKDQVIKENSSRFFKLSCDALDILSTIKEPKMVHIIAIHDYGMTISRDFVTCAFFAV